MEPSSEKFSISMTESDMRFIDQMAGKLGLSRSELIRQSIAKFAKDRGLTEVYVPSASAPPGAVQWIIAKSHGPLGDFRMPFCTQLIVQHNLAGKLSEDDLRLILRRYREHVDFWTGEDGVVMAELDEFADAAKVSRPTVRSIFYASGGVRK